MTTLEILKAARELLAVPERWTKGALARSQNGDDVNPKSSEAAHSFCIVGAIGRSNIDYDSFDLAYWNDAPERTHAEVLARFDEAIVKLEEKVC